MVRWFLICKGRRTSFAGYTAALAALILRSTHIYLHAALSFIGCILPIKQLLKSQEQVLLVSGLFSNLMAKVGADAQSLLKTGLLILICMIL